MSAHNTIEGTYVWTLVALRSTAMRNSHGFGRVDSILFTRLAMLSASLANVLANQ